MGFIRKLSNEVIIFVLFIIIVLLVFFSDKAKSGAIQGINLCENIILPSLLPILIISNILIKITEPRFLSRLFSKVFKLPTYAFPCIFFGLVSGFPAGAILSCSLYETGALNEKQSKRIMSFNFCGGAAFIISTVGGVIYKNNKAGLILFLSCVLSSIIVMILSRFFDKSEETKPCPIKHNIFSSALCESAETSVKSIAIMSAFIILFSALMNIISIPKAVIPLLEITNGICLSESLLPLPYSAFFLSFGGLCIHLQLFPFLKKLKIKYIDFLLSRILCASLSYLICRIMIHFSADSSLVSYNTAPSLPFEMSKLGNGLSLVMIIGCAVIVFDIENRKLRHSGFEPSKP